MAKKKQSASVDLTYKYDSNEELYICWYLEELYSKGYIKEFTRQGAESYILSLKKDVSYIKKIKKRTNEIVHGSKVLLHSHIYTPDFDILWDKSALGKFISLNEVEFALGRVPFYVHQAEDYLYSCIEVKPEWNAFNMTRLFTLNQKWVHDKWGVFVQMVQPVPLFKKTFTPNRYLLTDKSMVPRTLKHKPRTFEEYLATIS